MGALRAAVKVAAPEAAAVGAAAGAVKGKQKPPAADPRQTHPGSEAARQRQAVEDVKARRAPEHQADDEQEHDEHQADGEHQAGGGFGAMSVPSTGSGFVLGVVVWALFRAWIGNPGGPSGADGVKALLRAKFLNQPLPSGGQQG